MAWRLIGNQPLSEPMLTRFNDAYMRYYGEMGQWLWSLKGRSCIHILEQNLVVKAHENAWDNTVKITVSWYKPNPRMVKGE